jgi:hypothetical protein
MEQLSGIGSWATLSSSSNGYLTDLDIIDNVSSERDHQDPWTESGRLAHDRYENQGNLLSRPSTPSLRSNCGQSFVIQALGETRYSDSTDNIDSKQSSIVDGISHTPAEADASSVSRYADRALNQHERPMLRRWQKQAYGDGPWHIPSAGRNDWCS